MFWLLSFWTQCFTPICRLFGLKVKHYPLFFFCLALSFSSMSNFFIGISVRIMMVLFVWVGFFLGPFLCVSMAELLEKVYLFGFISRESWCICSEYDFWWYCRDVLLIHCWRLLRYLPSLLPALCTCSQLKHLLWLLLQQCLFFSFMLWWGWAIVSLLEAMTVTGVMKSAASGYQQLLKLGLDDLYLEMEHTVCHQIYIDWMTQSLYKKTQTWYFWVWWLLARLDWLLLGCYTWTLFGRDCLTSKKHTHC